MKKMCCKFILAAAAVMTGFVACNPSGPGTTDSYKAGDVAKSSVTIDGRDITKTAEVYATPPRNVTITGSNIDATYSGFNGVFIEGRTVTLSPFIIGKYEVTRDLYKAVMDKPAYKNVSAGTLNPDPSYSHNTSTRTPVSTETAMNFPVESITWYDAVWFCNALSEICGYTKAYDITITGVDDQHISNATVTLNMDANGYRLPTEAEWEFAARGGDQSKTEWNYTYSGAPSAQGKTYKDEDDANINDVGWYKANTCGNLAYQQNNPGYSTHEVGLKNPNRLGLYDMSGNAWELCYDWYGPIETGAVTNPTGPAAQPGSNGRVDRGGSWKNGAYRASVNHRGVYNRNDDGTFTESWTGIPAGDTSSDSAYYSDAVGFRLVRKAPAD